MITRKIRAHTGIPMYVKRLNRRSELNPMSAPPPNTDITESMITKSKGPVNSNAT